jgi:hypothetical protein
MIGWFVNNYRKASTEEYDKSALHIADLYAEFKNSSEYLSCSTIEKRQLKNSTFKSLFQTGTHFPCEFKERMEGRNAGFKGYVRKTPQQTHAIDLTELDN